MRLPSGESHHAWTDAQSFLDVKYDRTSYSSAGVAGTVAVFYRNYKTVEGPQIPAVIETAAAPDKISEKLVIKKIALNPPLDILQSRPAAPARRAYDRRGPCSGAQSPTCKPVDRGGRSRPGSGIHAR